MKKAKYDFLENGDLNLNGVVYSSNTEGAGKLFQDITAMCNTMNLTLNIMVCNETINSKESYLGNVNFCNTHLLELNNVHTIFNIHIETLNKLRVNYENTSD